MARGGRRGVRGPGGWGLVVPHCREREITPLRGYRFVVWTRGHVDTPGARSRGAWVTVEGRVDKTARHGVAGRGREANKHKEEENTPNHTHPTSHSFFTLFFCFCLEQRGEIQILGRPGVRPGGRKHPPQPLLYSHRNSVTVMFPQCKVGGPGGLCEGRSARLASKRRRERGNTLVGKRFTFVGIQIWAP